MNILSQSFIAGQSLSLSYNSNHARSTMCDEYAPICTRFFNQPFFLEFFQVGSCHLNKTGAGFAKCPSVSLSHACQCSDGNAEHWSKYATSSSSSLDSIHRVKWRHISVVTVRSPFCGATPSYCVWLCKDLSRYSNKIESVGLTECLYYCYLTKKVMSEEETFRRTCPTKWWKAAGIDMIWRNYVTVILCINREKSLAGFKCTDAGCLTPLSQYMINAQYRNPLLIVIILFWLLAHMMYSYVM